MPQNESTNRFIRERLLTSLEIWFVKRRLPALRELLAAANPRRVPQLGAGHELPSGQVILDVSRQTTGSVSTGLVLLLATEWIPRWIATCGEQLLSNALGVRPNSFPLLMTLGNLNAINEKESAFRSAGWYRAALATTT